MSATSTWAPAAASTPAIASPIPRRRARHQRHLAVEREQPADRLVHGRDRTGDIVAAMSADRIEIAKKLFAGVELRRPRCAQS